MSVRRHTSPDEAAAAEACAHHVITILEEVLSGQEFATLAISGGSTPRLMFQKLAVSNFRWDHVHLFWVDERSVPPTDPASNYRMADEYLIRPAHIPQRHVHRIAGEMPPRPRPPATRERSAKSSGSRRANFRTSTWCIAAWVPTRIPPACFQGEPLIEDREGIAAEVFVAKLTSGASRCCRVPCWPRSIPCSGGRRGQG